MRIEEQLTAARELVLENDLVLVRYLVGPGAMSALLEAPVDPRVETQDGEVVAFGGVPVVPEAREAWFTIDVSTKSGERVHGHIAQALRADWESRIGARVRGVWGRAPRIDDTGSERDE